MRNSAMILGIIGGILGMIFSVVILIAGVAMRFAGTMIPNKMNIPSEIQRLLPLLGTMAAGKGAGALIFYPINTVNREK